jgi:hypothetical protein
MSEHTVMSLTRAQTLALLVTGSLIPLLVTASGRFFFLFVYPGTTALGSTKDVWTAAIHVVLLITLIVVCFRFARYDARPKAPAVMLLMGLSVAFALIRM